MQVQLFSLICILLIVSSCAKVEMSKDSENALNQGSSATSVDSDCDGDGLTTAYENLIGTNPNNPDTDDDGLSDGKEVNEFKTNPRLADTDSDGLIDGAEVNTFLTSPTMADTDGGGLKDGDEVKKGLKPLQDNDDSSAIGAVNSCS